MTSIPVVNIAGRNGELLNQSGICISSNMSLETVHRFPASMASPGSLTISMARRGTHRGIDQGPCLDGHSLGSELLCYGLKHRLIDAPYHQLPPESHEGRALGRGFLVREPAETPE
jgi:hypothetical protein